MRARAAVTPVALLLLAGATAAYAYLVDRGSVSDADRAARRRDVFPSFRVGEVTRIELTHGSEVLVLERGAEGDAGGVAWSMTSPRREAADAGVVDVLLRELEGAKRERDVQPGDARGLDHPRAKGTVRLGALEYVFVLGDEAPRPEGAAYMRLEGEGTFVVSRALAVQLLRGADAYRERALVPFGAAEIARLEVSAPGGGYALVRSGASFRLPDGTRASRSAVEHLLSALADARADSFLDDAQADRAMAGGATITVTPRTASRQTVVLRIGGSCPPGQEGTVAVRVAPSRMSACVPTSVGDVVAARAGVGGLTDASPFFAHADEIEELRTERLGPDALVVEVARRGNGWHARAPEERDLSPDESDTASALARALAEARASTVTRTAAEPFTPRVRATVVRTGGSTTEIVELGAPRADGTTPLRRQDDGAILALSRDAARRFEPQRASLRASSVWRALDAGDIVALESTCGAAPEHLELHDGTWLMKSPPGLAADPVSVSDLSGALAHAKADAWVADSDDGSFGFAAPGASASAGAAPGDSASTSTAAGPCEVTFRLGAAPGAADGGAPRRDGIVFGGATQGGFFAHTLQDPAIFVVPAVLRAVASHPAIERHRFRLDLRAIDSLTAVRAGKRYVLSAEPGDDDRAARAVEALYAQVALHAGPPQPAEGIDRPTLEIVATSRPDAGSAVTRITLGAPARVDEIDGYFARVSGVDATFLVPRQVVDSILGLLGG